MTNVVMSIVLLVDVWGGEAGVVAADHPGQVVGVAPAPTHIARAVAAAEAGAAHTQGRAAHHQILRGAGLSVSTLSRICYPSYPISSPLL